MSYFNHPVKVPVFKAAMTGLIERILRKAGKSEDVRIQLLFVGEMACVIWSYIGGIVRGTLRLPALKENSVIDREKANRWVGYILHEIFHVLMTCSDTWQLFAAKYPGLRKKLANALEDARIERAGMARGYADGFKIVGKDLLAHLMVTGGMNVNPNDPRQIPWVFAVGCRGYGVKGEARLLSALDPRIKVILAEAKRQVWAIDVNATPKEGTMTTCAIALWVYAELQKLNTPTEEKEEGDGPGPGPVNPPPPGEEPGEEGEEGDGPVGPGRRRPPKDDDETGRNDREPTGDEDDDERDEGEADDSYDDDDEGEPGDEPGGDGEGDGEGDSPLRVGDKVTCPDGTKGRITSIDENEIAEVSAL